MFSINKESDYALNAIYYLSKNDEYMSITKISEDLNIPKRYLAKILSKISSVNILTSKEGKTGGYKLNKKLEDINLYDFLIIFEDDLSIVKCGKNGHVCCCSKYCAHKNFFEGYISNILIRQLKSKSLKDVFNNKNNK